MKLNKCKFSSCFFSGISIGLAIIVLVSGCNKLVEVESPPTSLTSENIYTNDATAASVFTGLYTSFGQTPVLRAETINSLSLVSALSADELTLHGGAANANINLVLFYQNRLIAGSSDFSEPTIWKNLYANLYIVNLAIERLSGSTSLTPSVKQQLTGEAKFLRAFFYFYLVNLYGDVPLTTTSNYQTNAKLSRSSSVNVYELIIADLKDAENLLLENYVAADAKTVTTERLRPNKWSAIALLARVYLFRSDWSNAESKASLLINNKAMYDTVSLSNTFLKNSKESIWQLQPVNIGWNTEDARAFLLSASGPTSSSPVEGYPVYISDNLLNVFENHDRRKSQWMNSITVSGSTGSTTYYYPYKYKSATLNAPVTEYLTVLRLGEQYLIRAEARAQQGNISGAKDDLNTIRNRAGLPATGAADNNSLLAAIMIERQRELFTEWGHRWLDLKRTGKVDEVMQNAVAMKNTTWSSTWQWYPIPQYDIIQNPNLEQNKGY